MFNIYQGNKLRKNESGKKETLSAGLALTQWLQEELRGRLCNVCTTAKKSFLPWTHTWHMFLQWEDIYTSTQETAECFLFAAMKLMMQRHLLFLRKSPWVTPTPWQDQGAGQRAASSPLQLPLGSSIDGLGGLGRSIALEILQGGWITNCEVTFTLAQNWRTTTTTGRKVNLWKMHILPNCLHFLRDKG